MTLSDVLTMHDVLMQRYGGASGIRDMGAVESALHRPQSGYYEDIIQEAAALMESFAINHPFVDGNKRVAFAVTDVFLRINGYRITQSPMDIYEQMIEFFEQRTFNMEFLEPWLRGIVVEAN
ncbi:MAG: death-on-curing protein [Gammaproteobacteria bacterium]|jgi:death-on-curing protein